MFIKYMFCLYAKKTRKENQYFESETRTTLNFTPSGKIFV